MMIEKFSINELSALRSELLQGGLDSWQAAEVFQLFLAGRGYGVAPDKAFDAAGRVESSGFALDTIQRELEGLALVM
jgi:hypothetical protein